MNLVEQFITESTDHHDEAMGHVDSIVNGSASKDHYHKHDAKQTGYHPVNKEHAEQLHNHLTANGYSHKGSKDDVHVYKKGKTTITSYHGDKDVNIHTKK